jgi:dihydrofolate reductase
VFAFACFSLEIVPSSIFSIMNTIIVAYDEERAIGKDGKVPWSLKEDMEHFRKTTGICPVIMGRKTWDSLPVKPLPDRMNFVVTRQHHDIPLFYSPSDPNWATSLEDALRQIEVIYGTKTLFIIGGGQIYKDALDKGLVDRVLASEVKGKHDGDTFFPELDGWTSRLLQSRSQFDIVEYLPAS